MDLRQNISMDNFQVPGLLFPVRRRLQVLQGAPRQGRLRGPQGSLQVDQELLLML